MFRNVPCLLIHFSYCNKNENYDQSVPSFKTYAKLSICILGLIYFPASKLACLLFCYISLLNKYPD